MWRTTDYSGINWYLGTFILHMSVNYGAEIWGNGGKSCHSFSDALKTWKVNVTVLGVFLVIVLVRQLPGFNKSRV